MSSIYSGVSALRTRYVKVPYTTLTTATSQASAVQVQRLDIATRYIFIDNKTDAEVSVYLVNPLGDSTATGNRLLWFELGSGEALNNDQIPALGMEIDPGTIVMMACNSGAPTLGYVKMLAWG